MRVKICTIKKIEDAMKVIEYGADAIGLLVGQEHPSKDYIVASKARDIVRQLPLFCSTVLLVAVADNDKIAVLAEYIGVTAVQLYGDVSTKDITHIRKKVPHIKIIKALHVVDEKSIEEGRKYLANVDAILLDSINKYTGQLGGTGLVHDWNLSRQIVESYSVPVILAGGLNPDNVKKAIGIVRPYGVDVSSGVKGSDGFKDLEKVRLFIQRAKGLEVD